MKRANVLGLWPCARRNHGGSKAGIGCAVSHGVVVYIL